VIPGLQDLIDALPNSPVPFQNTEFPFPVTGALFGQPPDLASLRSEAARLDDSAAAPQDAAWIALSAAEAVESARPDRADFFISDGRGRGFIFTGIKWRAGWVLLLGDDQEPYARVFDDAHFMTFTTRPDLDIGRFLGDRDTASIYFAQLLARYALLYSDVAPGDRHELTHFIEDHGPALLVITGPMRPVEALLSLSLSRLGVPAIVHAGNYPWEVGHRIELQSPDLAVAAAATFENLRIRSQEDPLTALPDYASPSYERQDFEPVARLGGDPASWFLLQQASETLPAEPAPPSSAPGEGSPIGLRLLVDDPTLDAPGAAELERSALSYLNLLRGVRVESRDPLTLALDKDAACSPDHLADVIRRGLRLEYPRLGPVEVQVITDPAKLNALAPAVAAEKARRAREIARLRETDEEIIFACESCAPFSREHVCLTHPLRTPMCGRRWTEMLVGARYMGVSAGRPWRRRGRPENCCNVVPLGRALDPLKGEYEGLNEFVRTATQGRMQRVFLHSVREHPHSSCGCFAALAWWSDDLGGLGLMHRGFDGAAPDGSTWNSLANRAGGKQQPGITGVGPDYLRSPKFLQGDGGWPAVKWMTQKLKDDLLEDVPEVADIPTEET
jgi:acetyl-CoA decarbonylase/synthase complex subunit beta